MELEIWHKGQAFSCFYDKEDAALVQEYVWHIVKGESGKLYVASSSKTNAIKMHRLIMNFPETEVDHKDGNGLNNRKKNLRTATHQQNCWNRKKKKDGLTSEYKGVSFKTSKGKWVVQINGRHVGLFTDEKEAALAYNTLAKIEHGEFALLNKIGE